MSEVFGRKYPLFLGYFLFGVFQIPVAVAQNVETIMLCRFFGGFFASSPLAIVGGMLADLFNPVERGAAICIFAGATFIGPVAGPIIGAFQIPACLGPLPLNKLLEELSTDLILLSSQVDSSPCRT